FGCEELVEARIERAAFTALQRRRLAVVRREHRRDDARCVLFPAQIVDGDHRLEERRREAAVRERSARVARGAIEQDVHRWRLLVTDVELGERAEDAHVARELAARGFERLLRLAKIAARDLVDRRQLDLPLALLLWALRLREELVLDLESARGVVLLLVDV